MPKFFRNFRIKAIELSKVKNYLFYAVGEIVLVVAGILIAVKVGDLSKEQEFKAALKLVEKDLKTEITDINLILESWRRKDSLSYRILEDKVTMDDLSADSSLLQHVIILRPEVALHYNGYKTVTKMLENRPFGYDAVLESLNELMEDTADEIDHFQKNMRDMATEYYVFQRDNQNWNWMRLTNKQKAVEKDYQFYQNDLRYKNWVTFHLTKQHSLMRALSNFRGQALNLLIELQQTGEQEAVIFDSLERLVKPKAISMKSCPKIVTKAIDNWSSIITTRNLGFASLVMVKNHTKDTLSIYPGVDNTRDPILYERVDPGDFKVIELPLKMNLYFFQKDSCIGFTSHSKYNQLISIQ